MFFMQKLKENDLENDIKTYLNVPEKMLILTLHFLFELSFSPQRKYTFTLINPTNLNLESIYIALN